VGKPKVFRHQPTSYWGTAANGILRGEAPRLTRSKGLTPLAEAAEASDQVTTPVVLTKVAAR